MATSKTDLCNSALIYLGANTIGSLNESSKPARLCNDQYDKLRKSLLSSHPWNFAMARKALSQTVKTPAFEYANEFNLPSDVLRVWETNIGEAEWRIEINPNTANKVLVTDETAVKILYIKDVTDVSLFDPMFEEALATKIAYHLAYPLVQSSTLMKNMLTIHQDILARARTANAQESQIEHVQADEWLEERF